MVFVCFGWDWSDFKAYFTGGERAMWKVLWITEDTLICVEDEYSEMDFDKFINNSKCDLNMHL